MVFDSVYPLAQNVVLEVEQLETGVDVLDKAADLNSELIVAQCDRVDGQPGQLVRQGRDRQQVLLDGDMEGIAVFQVHGHCGRQVSAREAGRAEWGFVHTLEELSNLLEG